jgi:hypothetical protein
MRPTVEAIAQRFAGQLNVGTVNVDEDPSLAARYQVLSIPTLMLFAGGTRVRSWVGLQPLERFERELAIELDRRSAKLALRECRACCGPRAPTDSHPPHREATSPHQRVGGGGTGANAWRDGEKPGRVITEMPRL